MSCFASSNIELQCKQFKYDNDLAPILPPDSQECLQRGSDSRLEYNDINEARNAYKIGMQMTGSKRNHRKYLKGSRYRILFDGYTKEIDVRKYGGMVDLDIRLDPRCTTKLKIRDLSTEKELMEEVKGFSERCNKDSEVRCSSGDAGKMFAFGYRNKKYGDYKSMEDDRVDIQKYSKTVRKVLDIYFKDEVRQIIEADRKQGIIPSEAMGGEDGISAYCLVSRDLVNAAHFDLDTSVGISIFNEKIAGMATNWYFVLPNTVLVGGDEERKAILIKLFDGCTLSWDGREVFHCTAAKDIGEGNHVYGNYWGGKEYK